MTRKTEADAGAGAGLGEEPKSASSGLFRWAIVAVMVVLLYPLTLWAAGAPAPASPPSAADALLDQSLQQAQAGRFEECIVAATRSAKLDPTSATAFNNIGFCAGNLQRWDEAIRNTQEAIRLAPDFQLAKNNLAWIQQEQAKAAADALLDQSLQQAQAGRFEECIVAATRSAKLDPTSATAFNNIGFCAGNLQRWDEAIRNTQEAIRLAPDFQLAKNNLAWIQQEKLKAGGSKAK